MEYYIRLLLLICATCSTVYGVVHLVRGKTSVLNVMATCTLFCFTLERLYEYVTILIRESLPTGFNLGMGARMGAFLFILTLSSSKLNIVLDGKNPIFNKQRLIALVAPLLILVVVVPVWWSSQSTYIKLATTTSGCVAAVAAYYNFKLLLLPKSAYGILEGIRWYNLIAILMLFFNTAQLLFEKMNLDTLWLISSVGILILYPLFIISMIRGGRNIWTR